MKSKNSRSFNKAKAPTAAKAGKTNPKKLLQKKSSDILYREKKGKSKKGKSDSLFGALKKNNNNRRRGSTELPLSHPGGGSRRSNSNNSRPQRAKTPPPPRRRPSFVVCMPQRTNVRAPWMAEVARKNRREPSSLPPRSSASACPLLKSISKENLERLDEELEQFANYVRLNDTESQARKFLIRRLEEIARELFQNPHKQGSGKHIRFDGKSPPSESKDIFMQIFGSFATQSVCMFQSDVDLALWGVVEPDEDDGSNYETERKKPAAVNSKAQKGNKKVNKWKSAIEEAADAISNAKTVASDSSNSDSPDDDPEELFVIDRIGAAESSFADDEIIDLTEPPKKQEPKERGLRAIKEERPAMICIEGNPLGRIAMTAEMLRKQTNGAKSDSKRGNKKKANGAKRGANEANKRAKTIDLVGNSKDVDKVAGSLKPRKKSHNRETDGAGTTVSLTEESSEEGVLSTSADDAIRIRGGGSDNDGNDNSDEDTADKLDGLRPRAYSLPDAEETHFVHKRDPSVRQSWGQVDPDVESISSSSSAEDGEADEPLDDSELEVSFFSDSTSPQKTQFGPSGETRERVVRALNTLSKKIRKPKVALAKQLTVRKHARVPIINLITPFGYECDIALGGHNGTDTSAYAATQADKYKSFAPVVLILKVMLIQNNLDKPFTGGLGSFKLYVLVAHHIKRYLAKGGEDRPAEVLLSFLFRYGKVSGHGRVPAHFQTTLSRFTVMPLDDGGSADLGGVHQVDNCVSVFGAWWDCLWRILQSKKLPPKSILSHVVDCDKLDRQRRESVRQAKNVKRYISDDESVEENNGSAVNQTTRSPSPRKTSRHNEGHLDTDEEVAELEAGYGIRAPTKKRSSSGGNNNRGSTKKRSKKDRKEGSSEKDNKRKVPSIDAPLGAERGRPQRER